MSDIADVWTRLRADDSRSSGVVRRRILPEAPIDVYVAVEKPENHLSLQVEADGLKAVRLLRQNPRGLRIVAETLQSVPESRIRCTIQLVDAAAEDLFEIVVSDLLSGLNRQTSAQPALNALASRLAKWQAFFARHGTGGLSADEQQGLYGELWFMRELLSNAPGNAVPAWVGPGAANQDFQFQGRALETKTTSANPAVEVHISNLLQLDDHGLDDLALLVLQVSRIANSPETLVDMVDAVRALVRQLVPQASAEFEEKLILAGYLDSQSADYRAMGYAVRRVDYYRVDDGFPRLVAQDVPSGVGDVRYSVSIAVLAPFAIDAPTVHGWFGRDSATG